MKKIILALVLVSLLAILAGCTAVRDINWDTGGSEVVSNSMQTYAKVRYFDGENEMIPISAFGCRDGLVRIVTTSGDILYVGANNIMIVSEPTEHP